MNTKIKEFVKNVAISDCNKNSMRGKLDIPKEILEDMGITKEEKQIKLTYHKGKKEIVIRKVK